MVGPHYQMSSVSKILIFLCSILLLLKILIFFFCNTGSKYAMLSMKTTISTLLRSFSVHTDIKMEDIKLKVDLLMRSAIGYPITLQPRVRKPIPIQSDIVTST